LEKKKLKTKIKNQNIRAAGRERNTEKGLKEGKEEEGGGTARSYCRFQKIGGGKGYLGVQEN